MSSKAETLRRVRSRDFEAIEDEWLERLDDDPTDTAYFIEVGQALADTEQAESARPLLRLLDDELAERGALRERLEVFLELGEHFVRPGALHEAVVDVLHEIYAGSDNLDAMLRVAGLHRQPNDLRTLRLQADRMHSLMLLDVGSVVAMEDKGVGTITEINFDLGRYKVDFESIPALTIGFKAGAKLLQPLPEGHILRDKLEHPERLQQLRDEQPSELLREVLESHDEPLTAAQIRAALEGIVSRRQWSSWWTAARKHPQVLVSTDKRHRYHWAASSDHAAQTLTAAFEEADLEEQLEIFAKNARQNPELAADLATTLEAEARAAIDDEPARALEIWYALSRAGLAGEDDDFGPAAVVDGGADVVSLARKLSRKALRESLYDEVARRRDDWVESLSACVLAEEDPALAGALLERIATAEEEQRERLLDRVLGRPQDHPGAFVWLAQAASENEELRRQRPARLFRQLLRAPGLSELGPYRGTLAPLLESGGTLPKLLADLADDDAEAALEAVKRSQLEEYLKSPLIAALEMRFTTLRQAAQDRLYALPESIDERREEARRLEREEIPANRNAIQEAAALGDLRENFEYKSARERHEYLSARLARLQADLASVQPIVLDGLSGEEVRIGSSVELEGAGARRQITVLGPWESDPEAGLLSYQSDAGQTLLGARLGDRLQLEGSEYEVTAIRAYDPD